MAEVTINKINTNYSEDYTEKDLKLIPSFDVISQFTPETDEVEFSIYNEQGLLESINYDYKDYTVTFDYNTQQNSVSTVNVDTEEDVIKAGYEQGSYSVTYNFFRNQISSSQSNPFYIKQISSDRTEIRIANNNIGSNELDRLVTEFKSELSSSAYFEDFQLNFGNNNIFIANNILIDSSNEAQYTVLIKLYEPLEGQFTIKDTLWVTLQTAEEVSYQVSFLPKVVPPPSPKSLKGPNFNIQLKDLENNSTTYQNLNTLTSVSLTSSYNQLQGILAEKGITVNIDYSDFNEFVYFSSAEERVKNFYYKVKLIETYQNEINTLTSGFTDTTISSSVVLFEKQIKEIIKNLDGYEKYQYYSSGSLDIYPKTNLTAPYNLAGTGSIAALAWLTDQATNSGSNYDLENPDRLVNLLPSFVKDNTTNAPFFLFMDMVGQHFDNIWTYTKDVANRFDADNRLNYGISKDIVADAIRSMGVNLYQNNFSSDDLYSALIGINASGSLLPPTGSEVIETYVTASSSVTKLDDVNKEIYKRIYHNLPYLLKKKGTVEGLRALINTYGIPDTILRISEFGGKDKNNSNDWDYFQNKFNYALYSSGSTQDDKAIIPFTASAEWGSYQDKPEAIFLKFKPGNILPSDDEYSVLFRNFPINLYLTLDYTGSAYSSGSYSGSIVSSSNDYATLTLWDGSSEVTHVDAPFYDGNWWGVLISREGVATNADVTLRTANSIYNGNDGFKIGYTASSAVTNDLDKWINQTLGTGLNIPMDSKNGVTLGSNTYYGLTGSFQEVRFYNTSSISKATFHDYVMNPYSIEGLNYSSSADNLIFRAPLGSNLNTSTGSLTSIHPRVTGSNTTHSFDGNSNYYISSSNGNLAFIPQTEFIYYDQPAVGIKNRISEKIRLEDNIVPSGDTLTPYRTIQQRYPQSESYTRDVNYVEVAFSPQNEINDDINSSMGYFNIGDYIGDPRQISSSATSYPDLDRLRDSYFDKYYKNYDWTDYIRLIKYFDNSLFKMIKDFVPAKSSLATGVVIKQHLLERNKQRPAQVELSQHDYSGSIESGFISGGNAGVYSDLSSVSPQVTQSWAYSVDTQYGPQIITQSDEREFYNGELSGSEFVTTTGELNDENTSKHPSTVEVLYTSSYMYLSNTSSVDFFVNSVSPNQGEIYLWYNQTDVNINKGVSYLSINKTDINEYNSSKNIEQADVIDIRYPIIGNTSYNILSTQDQGNYYLLGVVPQQITSSEGRFGFSLEASRNYNTNSPTLNPCWSNDSPNFFTDFFFGMGNAGSATGDATDFYSSGNSTIRSASYEFRRSPNENLDLVFSCSIINNTVSDSDLNVKVIINNSLGQSVTESVLFTLNCVGSTTSTQEIIYSLPEVMTSQGNVLTIFGESDAVAPLSASYAEFRIIAEPINTPSSSFINFSPEGINFNYSNGNPIINNAVDSRLSTVYQDIDYSTNYLIPVNFNLLSQGNAVKFPIPDSNYSQDSWKNGRYNGSRNSSLDFNL